MNIINISSRENVEMLTKETIKQWMARHPRLNLTQFLIRKVYPSKDACNEFLKYKEDPLCVQYKHYGDKNQGIPIYYAFVIHELSGYCSLVRFTLLYLAYAEKMKFIPVVEWSDKTFYAEKSADRFEGSKSGDESHSSDSFEYFFQPVSDIKKEDLQSSDLVIKAKYADINLIVPMTGYRVEEDEISILANMWDKYIRFNDAGDVISKKVDALLGGKRVIGVHIRRTDFSKNLNRHPISVEVCEYVNKIDELLLKGCYDHVFLATDEESVVLQLREKYGNKLLFFHDVYRSKDGKPVHYGSGRGKRSGYDLAADILMDVLALGRCDGLVAGLSNVCTLARAIKKSRGFDYKDKLILNNGLNRNMKESIFFVKK